MNYLETQIKGAGVNVDAKYAPPKKEGRSVYKYIYKYNMDARCLTDVLRHSFVFENMKDLVTGLTTIKEICGDEFVAQAFKLEDKIPQEQNSTVACKLTLLRIKNRFHEESITGYRDINLNVLMEWTQPKTETSAKKKTKKVICEIQLHIKKILEVKDTKAHATYAKMRLLNDCFQKKFIQRYEDATEENITKQSNS